MKALEKLAAEKQIELQQSRNMAQKVWTELRTMYDGREPEVK